MPWSPVEQDFVVLPQTRLLRVQIIRQPSMRFDNKVSGTAWINELKLEPIGPSTPQHNETSAIEALPFSGAMSRPAHER